jgi:hypothetical protein
LRNEVFVGGLGHVLEVVRNFFDRVGRAHGVVVVVDNGLLVDDIDLAFEVILFAKRDRVGQALAPSFWRMEFTALSKSAPVRSILLTKAMRGTPYLVAWRQTVSDWG